MKSNSFISAVKNYQYAVREVFRIYPIQFFATLLFSILDAVFAFFTYTYLLRIVVNGIQSGLNIYTLSTIVIETMVVYLIYRFVKHCYDVVLAPIINIKSNCKLKKKLYKKSLELDISCYENPESYELYNRAVSSGAKAIREALLSISNTFALLIKLALTSWMIFTIDPVLFLFAILPLFINIVEILTDKLWYRSEMKELELDRKNNYCSRVFYLADYAKEIRMTNIKNVIFDRLHHTYLEFIDLIKNEGIKKALIVFFLDFSNEIITIFGAEIYTIYKTVESGQLLVGDCLVVLTSIDGVAYSIQNIGGYFEWFYEISLRIQDYKTFLEQKERIVDGIYEVGNKNGNIVFNNVSFQYPNTTEYALKNINFTIGKGQNIAVVGDNGAGKTTLVKLLLRLYDPSNGSIVFCNNDIRDYNLKQYRRKFRVVLQDYKPFALTIAENIMGGNVTKDDRKKIISALEKAELLKKISDLPKGIDTQLTKEFSEDGVIFSGGELQKLAIASIYACDNDIVVLDEPSSFLDPIAEQRMYEKMTDATKNKTVIMITHRLSAAISADKIIFMKNGEAIEIGTHDELMNRKGEYYRIYNLQSENYID